MHKAHVRQFLFKCISSTKIFLLFSSRYCQRNSSTYASLLFSLKKDFLFLAFLIFLSQIFYDRQDVTAHTHVFSETLSSPEWERIMGGRRQIDLRPHSGSVSASPIGNIATGPAAASLALYASGSNQRIGACQEREISSRLSLVI